MVHWSLHQVSEIKLFVLAPNTQNQHDINFKKILLSHQNPEIISFNITQNTFGISLEIDHDINTLKTISFITL
jgi:hypothetical protein